MRYYPLELSTTSSLSCSLSSFFVRWRIEGMQWEIILLQREQLPVSISLSWEPLSLSWLPLSLSCIPLSFCQAKYEIIILRSCVANNWPSLSLYQVENWKDTSKLYVPTYCLTFVRWQKDSVRNQVISVLVVVIKFESRVDVDSTSAISINFTIVHLRWQG